MRFGLPFVCIAGSQVFILFSQLAHADAFGEPIQTPHCLLSESVRKGGSDPPKRVRNGDSDPPKPVRKGESGADNFIHESQLCA